MSTKHLGLSVQRIREDEGADSLRAIATYVWASTHGTAKTDVLLQGEKAKRKSLVHVPQFPNVESTHTQGTDSDLEDESVTFTIHRCKTPNNPTLRCAVRDVEGHIVVSRRTYETQWRIWIDRVDGVCLFAPDAESGSGDVETESMKITVKRWTRKKDPLCRVRVYADGQLIILRYQSSAHVYKWNVAAAHVRYPAKTLKEALVMWRLLR